MSSNSKALRIRIKSVNSTLQLTNAMGLVASSKIKRANENMQNAKEYAELLKNAMSLLTGTDDCLKSPYLRTANTIRTKIIAIAGDRGMAGGYNANVFRLCESFADAQIFPIGKRACDRFDCESVSSEHFSDLQACKLSDELCTQFANDEFDRLGVIYTQYVSVMEQRAQILWLLPLKKTPCENKGTVFEPDCISILNNAVREYVAGLLTACIRESFASEVTARRLAMDSAGKNARQMLDDLALEYNRARQSAITQEITEIVAGSGD